jgi:hypothetical protein
LEQGLKVNVGVESSILSSKSNQLMNRHDYYNQIKLSPKQKFIEFVGIAIALGILVGSFLKVMFF